MQHIIDFKKAREGGTVRREKEEKVIRFLHCQVYSTLLSHKFFSLIAQTVNLKEANSSPPSIFFNKMKKVFFAPLNVYKSACTTLHDNVHCCRGLFVPTGWTFLPT